MTPKEVAARIDAVGTAIEAELGTQRACLVDLRATENTLIPRRKRLRDRGRRPEHVDHHAEWGGSRLDGSECDVDAHPTTLLRAWLKRSSRPVTGIPTG